MNKSTISQACDNVYNDPQTPQNKSDFEEILKLKINSFEPIHHEKPIYDIYGRLINSPNISSKNKFNILSKNPRSIIKKYLNGFHQ